MIISLLGLVIGFTLLVFGADWFVKGASGLAKRFGVPSVIVGLTVVAFGTSAPELAVSVTASLRGANEIALGNVLGSNIFNLLAVVGASALVVGAHGVRSLTVAPDILRRDWLASIGATAILLVFAFANGEISRLDAACLLLCFCSILVLQICAATRARRCAEVRIASPAAVVCGDEAPLVEKSEVLSVVAKEPSAEAIPALGMGVVMFYILVGLICIVLGGQCSVGAASSIARVFGLSESLIGLTIVAIGTSLPELVTSVIATRQNETDIAVGNVIGSNLFNILFILGTACLINPIAVDAFVVMDTVLLLVASVLLWFVARKNVFGRMAGMLMLLSYFGYATWVVVR